MAISQRRLSLEEFLRLPEDEPALELVAGRVTQKVSPKGPHGKLEARLAWLFDSFGEPDELASSFVETRVSFAGDSLVPDVVVYRWDRIPRDAHGEVAEDFMTAPDIAIEIFSPGQTLRDLVDRCRWFVANGVEISLLIHARQRTVTLFRAGAEPEALTGDARIDLDGVLPGFQLTVNGLFRALSLRQ